MAKEVITVTMDKEFYELLMANAPQGGGGVRSIIIKTINMWSDELIEESTIEVPANATKWSDFVTQTSPNGRPCLYYRYIENDSSYYVYFIDKYDYSGKLETGNGGYVKIDDTIDFNMEYTIKVDA